MKPLPLSLTAYALVWVLAPVWANADDVFKCMGGDGNVFYQSTKCEEGQQSEQMVMPAVETPSGNSFGRPIINDNISKSRFNTTGLIQGVAVPIVVNPSGDNVLIPTAFAYKIGIDCGSHSPMDNRVCKSVVRSLKIGNIALTDVVVYIVPFTVSRSIIVGQQLLGHQYIPEAPRQHLPVMRMMGR